jgi:hypothetical protein
MTVPDVSYITAEEVKEQSLNTGLTALTDGEVESLISIAEDQIDAYVGPQPHHPSDTNIERVFPREQDHTVTNDGSGIYYDTSSAEVPYKVARACLRQVEWLYVNWWDDRTSSMLPTEHDASSVSIGGDGSYSETRRAGGSDHRGASLSSEAKSLLEGFKCDFCGIDVTDPDLTHPPS